MIGSGRQVEMHSIAAVLLLLAGCSRADVGIEPASQLPTVPRGGAEHSAAGAAGLPPATAVGTPGSVEDGEDVGVAGSDGPNFGNAGAPFADEVPAHLSGCSLSCRADGADPDGEPLRYFFGIQIPRVSPNHLTVSCGLGGGGGGGAVSSCDAARSHVCELGDAQFDADGTASWRRVSFRLGDEGVVIEGSKGPGLGGAATATWTDLIAYDRCQGSAR